MRFYLALLFTLVAAVLALPAPQKPVVVQYPEDTPASVIQHAIEEIKKDGGIITHEYSLIKGFAARVSEVTLKKIAAMADSYIPLIESDYVVHVDGTTTTSEEQ
ncbi:hypothetical protein ABEF95_006099 [Exophiala dermatitidis]